MAFVVERSCMCWRFDGITTDDRAGAGQMATFSYRTYSDADFSEVFAQAS